MTKKRNTQQTRRQALKAGVTAIAAPTLISGSSLGRGRVSASERIRVGVVGLGSRGFNLLDALLRHPEAQITMLCDVDDFHYRDQPWGKGRAFGLKPAQQHVEAKDASTKGLRLTKDFEEVCGSDNVDAVVIATPDHWHALATLKAIRNGKDVYCEKPVTHTFAEGQLVCQAIRKQKTIFQTGSQQRSSQEFRHAVELIRNGHLGTLQEVQVGLNPGYKQPQGDSAVQTPPESLDYEMWCGPAPTLPYMRARHHRWWRGHRAFGGGVLMDWIGHHNDIAHWAMDADLSGPTKVEAVGWTFPESRVYNTPHQYEIQCEYESGVKTSIASKHPNGVLFRGDEGWLFVTRGKLKASNESWIVPGFNAGPQKVYQSDNHMGNFLNGIRSRKECISPAHITHRSITPGHLGYVSQQLQRPIQWDPARELIINDSEAMNSLMQNDYRSPWDEQLKAVTFG